MARGVDEIDRFGDELPGPKFAAALHALRRRGPVVPVRALGSALPVFYIVGYPALAAAFRDGERFPPGHAYQIISQPYIGETFMSMDEDRHRIWRPPMTPSFRRIVIDALEESELVPIAHDLVDRIGRDGRADLVRARRREPRNDVISRWLRTEVDGEPTRTTSTSSGARRTR